VGPGTPAGAPQPQRVGTALELDRYLPGDSVVHRADARVKLLLAIGAILAIGLVPVGGFAALSLVWVVLLALSIVAGLGPWRLTRSSWVALPFMLIALPLLFTRPGAPLATIELGVVTLTITDQGVREVATILLKSWLSVQVALLLAFTTEFPDLIDALRALRVPAIIVSIISFMYRYLAVLTGEAGRMNRAKLSRSAVVSGRGGGSLRWRAGVTGAMVGSLFLRSYERSERIHAAMLARGFQGQLRHQALERPTDRAIVGAAAVGIVMVVFVLASQTVVPRW
jgi:cobalt/nickel transport system permease protein